MSVQTQDPLRPLFAHSAPSGNEAERSASISSGHLSTPPSMHPEMGFGDEVVQSLFEALKVATHNNDRQCMESLRLAIAVRKFGLRTDVERTDRVSVRGRHIEGLQKWRLKRVIDYIDADMSSKINSRDLAAVAGLSRMHFASQFRVATGLRPHEFLLQRRIRRAAELMRDTTMPIIEIALSVGFQTQAHFTTVFKQFTGCTPRNWRVGNHMLPRSELEEAAAELP
ncbi:helix-turn-helix transcriptional regulator [Bradyrhizobium sp. 159]|uniref:helix-turn-helix transcriptional regulator n=1 Tax=Bradyrhizobium sp. 159 TaxID=2782632 RepID=UPI001FF7E659|nr:AraC family transcriptional regulator [Bradyrhizobium sp. 159]MCK1616488.1 helix-turn-helix transcriptional regulator [Bradyrhizobium sp. 159]